MVDPKRDTPTCTLWSCKTGRLSSRMTSDFCCWPPVGHRYNAVIRQKDIIVLRATVSECSILLSWLRWSNVMHDRRGERWLLDYYQVHQKSQIKWSPIASLRLVCVMWEEVICTIPSTRLLCTSHMEWRPFVEFYRFFVIETLYNISATHSIFSYSCLTNPASTSSLLVWWLLKNIKINVRCPTLSCASSGWAQEIARNWLPRWQPGGCRDQTGCGGDAGSRGNAVQQWGWIGLKLNS